MVDDEVKVRELTEWLSAMRVFICTRLHVTVSTIAEWVIIESHVKEFGRTCRRPTAPMLRDICGCQVQEIKLHSVLAAARLGSDEDTLRDLICDQLLRIKGGTDVEDQ